MKTPFTQGNVTRKFHIKTYGCQMNVYDSQRMADILIPLGYEAASGPEEADLVILNTCHIREKAEEKVYSDLGRLRALQEERGERKVIAVGGCVGQAEGEEIMRRAPYVDLVFGPQSYHHLPDMLARHARDQGKIVELDFAPEPKFDALPLPAPLPAGGGPSAFLSIQEGCDKFCTFCVVPYTRGKEYARPASAILREAEALVANGAVEITLLGQNVNAWRAEGTDGQEWNFARLLRRIGEIQGLRRLRYTTSHPRDMDDDLIELHGESEVLMPFLHLPVQSGSDRVLARMNRKHKAADYLLIIEKLRAKRPDMAFSSDFIVGFPGETDLDFAATLRLIETVGYAQCYSFKYSPRPGTPAANAREPLPESVKVERLTMLQELLMRQQLAFNQASEGKEMEVLFDRKGKRPGQLLGKTPYMQSVYLEASPSLAGTIQPVLITEGFQNSLTGLLADAQRRNRPLSELDFKERERWFDEHRSGAYSKYVSIGAQANRFSQPLKSSSDGGLSPE